MIRTLTPNDAPALYEIFTSSLGYACETSVIRSRIEELAHDPRFICLAWQDANGCVRGFIHAMRYDTLHSTGGWDVISLAVAPKHQNEGIGRELLFACEEEARKRGGTYVRLNSRMERMAAHGFYEHVGYTCNKIQKRFVKQL